ncbi:reverse transcriptase domain-containing protein [Paenibacillus sp. YN15]|uniref:reverse transcriptase domain-containing protein n=1 Tax=Paenibacillus sp. YN15 TaxID=1742774 RepID=UPI000DCC08F9|nr:reverse transcriptase domain-containing protein [Paenibacillus sp. YN15]RAU96872.1 group II intron reverse transcriptase/maturase [Paenibacillus sp. YN15]
MRIPIEVLKTLTEKAKDPSYRFQRLYRNLYNPDFYMLAYQRIYSNDGSMTTGVDGTTIDGLSEKRIEKLIESLKDHSYQPKPARRTYIAKKNSNKQRPLGIPSADDKLLQEVVKMILESIYEPTFSDNSHGFRPNRSCHTALSDLQAKFTGAKWFIEGDIQACFDSFDHHVLIEILRRRIDDEAFIALMWKFLKAGYMEQWRYHVTYSGTPQGSGCSPILANIYLNELDSYMDEYKRQFDTGMKMKRNPEYIRLDNQARRFKQKIGKSWDSMTETERKEHAKALKSLTTTKLTVNPQVSSDKGYKRLQYIRYADDFIIGMIGSKADAEEIKEDIRKFLSEKLKLTLSVEKTKITHTSDFARFLSYDITVSRSQAIAKDKNGVRKRMYDRQVRLYVPHEKWASKLKALGAIQVSKDKAGNERYKAIHRSALINKEDISILQAYNSEVRGLYNYYCIANNASVIGKFGGLMYHSMCKTFAGKYTTKVKVIKTKYVKNGAFTVEYLTKSGVKQRTFYNQGYGRKEKQAFADLNVLPIFRRYDRPASLAARIRRKCCELCGKVGEAIEIHQVKRLKDLTGHSHWEALMREKRRKTLAVCSDCHKNIHKSKSVKA